MLLFMARLSKSSACYKNRLFLSQENDTIRRSCDDGKTVFWPIFLPVNWLFQSPFSVTIGLEFFTRDLAIGNRLVFTRVDYLLLGVSC